MALDWFKRKMAILSMSMSHAEKVALTNKGQSVELEAGVHQRLNQGSLKDALINGELTEEVKDLRWRMYKVLDAAENKKVAKFSGYDEETGNPIYEMVTVDPSKINLTKIKRDDFDDYPVILVVKNDEIVLGKVDATEGEFDAIKEGLKSIDGYVGEGKGVATISKSSYDSTVKTYRPILINRENVCTNPFENYATKLMVRRITDEEFLLEFYVSIYPDMYDVKTKFLIAEIKRAIENPRSTDIVF